MSQEEEKAKLFVARLLSNPSLRSLNPLQREEQILSFMEMNAQQLLPTLSSGAFFPGESWFKIHSLLKEVLGTLIDGSLLPGVQRQIYDKINFSFLSVFGSQKGFQDKTKDGIFTFVKHLLSVPEGRKAFSGSYNAIGRQIVDKYIEAVFNDHSYVHFELIKVQRLKMSKEEIQNFLKVSLLLRPVIYTFGTNMHKDNSSGIITTSFAEKVEESLRKEIPSLPEALIKSAVGSNVSFNDHKYLQATSRLTSIMSSLAQSIKSDITVDRGASTPEKSWFSIARRNYKYFGWDIKMLDELYRFSAENNW